MSMVTVICECGYSFVIDEEELNRNPTGRMRCKGIREIEDGSRERCKVVLRCESILKYRDINNVLDLRTVSVQYAMESGKR